MEKRNFKLIASTFILPVMWRLFSLILSNDKVDWFLFYDLEQKPIWYVFYSSYYVALIILSFVVYDLSKSKNYERLKTLSLFLIIVNILRLVVYWLFRGSLSLDVLVASVTIYALIILSRWRK